MPKRSSQLFVVGIGLVCVAVLYVHGRSLWVPVLNMFSETRTVADVVATYGASARDRLRPYFAAAGVAYPPDRVSLLGIKDAARLELWAGSESEQRFVRAYPILALSGGAGPKLREGDRQVPEGLYEIEALNPNSAYHLSLKLNYPNAFDREHAAAEGRGEPGTNIFIHGKAVSIGCLAMGDAAIEELFVLAVDVGKSRVRVAIAPSDPRLHPLSTAVEPGWVSVLYQQLNAYFGKYPRREG